MDRDDRGDQLGEADGTDRPGQASQPDEADLVGGPDDAGVDPEPPLDAQPDDPTDPELAPPVSPTLGRVPPVNRAMARVGQRFSGRPIAVYGVLVAGGLVLLTLLAIIWFSADDDDGNDGPICTDTSPPEAVALIKDGEVDKISIDYPQTDEDDIGNDIALPALMRLNLVDGNCRNLVPQGPAGEIDMYTVFGAAEWYNENTGQRRIDFDITENDSIPESILATVTPVPTPTVPITETPVGPATPVAEEPTETPSPTGTPTAPVVVDWASPAASPVASPEV
jgi:hypothetical protein